jgi:AbrB family looped-hinge helix DNA binding protein
VKKQARITSKGQITVPHQIRRALGVRPGDKLFDGGIAIWLPWDLIRLAHL